MNSGRVSITYESSKDCDCGDWNADTDLPFWPCYRDGFDVPNSDEPGADE
jgi:hypothetical protein